MIHAAADKGSAHEVGRPMVTSRDRALGIISCTKRKEPMDIQKIVNELGAERNRLDRAIAALESLSLPGRRRGRPPKAKQSTAAASRHGGGISLAGRKRLSELMKKRWAERKKKGTRKRKPMSAAARKKLSALMKARWAGRKKL
jgi:hypothetical protein